MTFEEILPVVVVSGRGDDGVVVVNVVVGGDGDGIVVVNVVVGGDVDGVVVNVVGNVVVEVVIISGRCTIFKKMNLS